MLALLSGNFLLVFMFRDKLQNACVLLRLECKEAASNIAE